MLDLSDFEESIHKGLDHFLAFVDMGLFAAAEDDGDLHLVFVLQESLRLIELELNVVVARLGPQANFLELGLVAVTFVFFLVLLVFVFAEVHDPANRRVGLRRDFH